jgi:hypothetical protein
MNRHQNNGVLRISSAIVMAMVCLALFTPSTTFAAGPLGGQELQLNVTDPSSSSGTTSANDSGIKGKAMGSLKGVGYAAGYDTGGALNPIGIVGNIIGYALGLLGVVFTILIIYAGYLWMTAQGNEEQIGKAKKMLLNAVIGMIIIAAAYAISNFVFDVIIKST